MSDTNTLNIDILGKEYRVSCPPEARQDLERAAQLLNTRMTEIKDQGKLFGLERIAVMTALNLSHDYLKATGGSQSLQTQLIGLNGKLDSILAQEHQMEIGDIE